MHIEDLKRWHWIVIALVVGAVLSSIYASTLAEGGVGEGRTMGATDFFWRAKATTRDKNDQVIPIIRNIRVYPAIDGKQVVTLEELVVTTDRATRARTGEYQPRQFVAEIPFSLGNRRVPPKDPNWSILEELKARKIEHNFAAWATKPVVYSVGMGGSLLLIGIIWPTILNRLQASGYGHAARDEKTVDLSKVRSSSSTASSQPKPPAGPTKQDLEQLDAVTAQYERNVSGMAIAAAQGSKAGAAVVETPQRKWDAGPIEVKQSDDKPAEEHVYGGEFYPVDRGVKKP